MIPSDVSEMMGSYRKKSSIVSLNARNLHDGMSHYLATIKEKKKRRLIPGRYVVVLLGFCTFVTLTTQRINISMALVAMVNQTATASMAENVETSTECPVAIPGNDTDVIVHKTGGDFNWSAKIQGHINSAGIFGYVLTLTPGGRLAETVGAKKMLTVSLVTASLCNLLTPLTAGFGPYVLVAVQLLKGVFQGFIQPALSCLMAKWYPPPEKGFLSCLTFLGFPGGSLIGGLTIGALLDSDFLGGWPSVFYIFGICGLILSVPIYFFIANSPEEDVMISEAELKYILSYREFTCTTQNLKTPWGAILKSPATWAVLIGLFSHNWMCFYFLSVHPTYLGAVLHFSHSETGILMSLPYILQFAVISLASKLSDVAAGRKIATTNTLRKICNTIASLGFISTLVGVSYAGCDKELNTICFIMAMSVVGFSYTAVNIVPLDMSINFAGSLAGFTNAFGTTAGSIIPLIVGAITEKGQTVAQWCKVFYLSMGVVGMGGFVFLIFGSARQQDWDFLKDQEQRKSIVDEMFDDPFCDLQSDDCDLPKNNRPYFIEGSSVCRI